LGSGGFVINGIDDYDYAGHAVSGAGDVNGDGFADILLSAYEADQGIESNAGESYVVFGKATTTSVNLATLGAEGFIINGIDSGDQSGKSLSGAGDVNGDGLADIIIGAHNADPGENIRAGESYVVFSPETAAAQGTYKMRSRAGDGVGGNIVTVTNFGDVARVKIDFSDDDSADNGSGGASTETVTITRSNSGITKLQAELVPFGYPANPIADVMWQISTDRINFTSAEVTFKYTDAEIAGVGTGSEDMSVFTAPSPRGPWTQLDTAFDLNRNEATVTVNGFSYFAIASLGGDVSLPTGWRGVAAALLATGLGMIGWRSKMRKVSTAD
jgi:hypothetical protein